MLTVKWWIHVFHGFSEFECQKMLGLYAGRWPKKLHYRSIPCLITLVGSGRYPITLLKYRLFHYIVELYPTFLHCWTIPNPKTCWDIPYLFTWRSNSQLLIHCRAIPNFNTCWAIPNPKTCQDITYLNTLQSNSQFQYMLSDSQFQYMLSYTQS